MVSSGDFSVMEICGYNYIMIPGMAFRMSGALDVAGGDYLILYSVEAHEEINGLDCYRYVHHLRIHATVCICRKFRLAAVVIHACPAESD
mgnify:CR=1 FL=1